MKKNGKLFSFFLYLIVSVILILSISNCKTSKIISSQKPVQHISVNLSIQSQVIKNIFSDANVWDFRTDWLDKAHDLPQNYFSTNYPFLKTIQFMTATGGNAERDLFVDPENYSDLTDYKFNNLTHSGSIRCKSPLSIKLVS